MDMAILGGGGIVIIVVIILLLIIIGIHIIHVISQQVHHAEANKLGPLANKLGLEALSLCQPVQTLELYIPLVRKLYVILALCISHDYLNTVFST